MAVENKMNEKKLRLLNLLREMFQLDQPDLDFGLYRIMHAKREQVEAFLATEFDQLIDQVFASRGARHEDEARKEYEAARQQAVEFGAPDPDAAPKVQQARARYEVVRLTGGEDAEIYDHLHRFFSRYYDEGDFMSLRRYGKGAAGGAESYAVPYDGSEVVLHWANKDQYYIKTTENFSHFSFDPRQALQKDERGISRQLFDDVASKVGAGGTALKVHFRVVDAAEGPHNNVKADDKDERYFILDDEALLARYLGQYTASNTMDYFIHKDLGGLPPASPAPLPQAGEGSTTWWFRPVEGYVRTVPGDDRHRRSVLVLWRSLSDDPEQDAACLEAFLVRQMKFDPKRREDKTLYDLIYINGTHNLPNLGKYGEVRLLEEEFHRRMWAGEEN